jgi:uncharacterized protein YegL
MIEAAMTISNNTIDEVVEKILQFGKNYFKPIVLLDGVEET